MKKRLALILAAAILTGCGGSSGGKPEEPESDPKISFEAYIREGESFLFELDPEDAVSYQTLREHESTYTVSPSDWRSYFDVQEVYREHYEYDDEGKPTSTFMRGKFYSIVLLDPYWFVDNWSRNGLEYEVFLDGTETRVMTNDGVTYDPVTKQYQDVYDFSGADPILLMTDFENSWDEMTDEKYTGQVNSYELVNIKGDLYLLDAEAVAFKQYQDNIWYFAAYEAPDEYFIIFLESEDGNIDRNWEYEGAVYSTSGARVNERYTGYKRIVPWEMIIELMKQVNGK